METQNKQPIANMYPMLVGLIVVAIITLAGGVYANHYWGWNPRFPGMDEAGKDLPNIPKKIGDWVALEDTQLDKTSWDMLNLSAALVRSYRNESTGEIVSTVLMVGPTGRIGVHTPEVCFASADYKQDGGAVTVPFRPVSSTSEETLKDNKFSKLSYTNKTFDSDKRIFYWAMGNGSSWVASQNPRVELSRYRYMYKLQCEAGIVDTGKSKEDVIASFLKVYLPAIQPYLKDCSAK